ncbi:MAG: glucose-6-phosphate isomerase [Planctomycetota bacterium]
MSRDYWTEYKARLHTAAGIALDLSRISIPDGYLAGPGGPVERAFELMARLEAGEKVNTTEGRMVGHYWLRDPDSAPGGLGAEIREVQREVKDFAVRVRSGSIRPQTGDRFENVLLVGIGGSALGPQLIADALAAPGDPIRTLYLDNTDPDGFDRVFETLGNGLRRTLTIVVSKSGGTPETRNGMIEVERAYERAGVSFARHAVAISMKGTSLDRKAFEEWWLARFPLWDWVGGRTSAFSPVGLLPAYLQGIDAGAMVAGAREMDRATRPSLRERNLAMLLALAWHRATEGRGAKDMVVLPYKDRLLLLSRYLQQLIMESLGKAVDYDGKPAPQGIAVYGNKGSTDQHSFVQQLRDGVHNFFVTFVEVLKDRHGHSPEVEPGVTAGDYLLGLLLGTRQALSEKGRESITITIEELSPATLGALIALYERAVGYYAGLIHVNAYDQPGVQAGKTAAGTVLEIERKAMEVLPDSRGKALTVDAIVQRLETWLYAQGINRSWAAETISKVLEHLVANRRGVLREPGSGPGEHRYWR